MNVFSKLLLASCTLGEVGGTLAFVAPSGQIQRRIPSTWAKADDKDDVSFFDEIMVNAGLKTPYQTGQASANPQQQNKPSDSASFRSTASRTPFFLEPIEDEENSALPFFLSRAENNKKAVSPPRKNTARAPRRTSTPRKMAPAKKTTSQISKKTINASTNWNRPSPNNRRTAQQQKAVSTRNNLASSAASARKDEEDRKNRDRDNRKSKSGLWDAAYSFNKATKDPPLVATDAQKKKIANRLEDPALKMSSLPRRTVAAKNLRRGGSTMNLSQKAKTVWDIATPIRVQGNTLKTWSFTTPHIARVQLLLKTDGRPLNADIDLWQGPDNAPQRMRVFVEDGGVRPFNAVVQTPGGQNAVAIKNTNTMEFPLQAVIEAEFENEDGTIGGSAGLEDSTIKLMQAGVPKTVQGGGAVFTRAFAPAVESVQIMVQTDGRPLHTQIELLQGPNNRKQVIDVYTENGTTFPFYIILETPGAGNVVRIVNTAPLEYPLKAYVEPYLVSSPAATAKALLQVG